MIPMLLAVGPGNWVRVLCQWERGGGTGVIRGCALFCCELLDCVCGTGKQVYELSSRATEAQRSEPPDLGLALKVGLHRAEIPRARPAASWVATFTRRTATLASAHEY